jgi:hypothetical protein
LTKKHPPVCSYLQRNIISITMADTAIHEVCRLCKSKCSQSNLVHHLEENHNIDLHDQDVLDVTYALATSVSNAQYKLQLLMLPRDDASFAPEANGPQEDVNFAEHQEVIHSSEDAFNAVMDETSHRPEDDNQLVEEKPLHRWVDETQGELDDSLITSSLMLLSNGEKFTDDDDIKVKAIVKHRRNFDVEPILNGEPEHEPTHQFCNEAEPEVRPSTQIIEEQPCLVKGRASNRKKEVQLEEPEIRLKPVHMEEPEIQLKQVYLEEPDAQLNDEKENEENIDFNPSQMFSRAEKGKRKRKLTEKVKTF